MMDQSTEINNTGARHFLNRQFEKAEKCYKEALELNPKNVSALNNMGLLYHQKKKYKKAIKYFKNAIQIAPKDTYYVNAGNAAACLNEAEEAESWYKKTLETNPGSVNAKQCLANLYQYNNRYEEAAPIWVDLIRSTGKDMFKIEYAQNLIKRMKYREAAEILTEGMSKETSRRWFLLGMCEYHMKNYGLAEEALKNGLAIDPDHIELRHYLAVTYLTRGDTEKGVQQLDKILKVNPENYQILTEKGVILLSQSKPTEALKLFDKSLSIKPEYKKAQKYKNLAQSLLKKISEQDDVEEKNVP